MSESEAERLARLETRMNQCEELQEVVRSLKETLDMMRGGYKAAYIIMAACGALGGMVAKMLPFGAK